MPSRTLLLACAMASAVAAQDPRPVLVEAATLRIAPGRTLTGPDARFVVRDGKVAAVGAEIPGELAQASRRVTFADATIVPGFVVAHHHLGLGEDLAETIDAFTPDLRVADAFDPWDEELAQLARTGVTCVGLAPLSKNTFGGIAAAVETGADSGRVIEGDAYLKLALVGASLDQGRYPTSRMGAVDLIQQSFEEARHPLALRTDATDVLLSALEGGRRVAIHADTFAEITCALDVCEALGVTPTLIGAREALEGVDRLAGSGVSLMLEPLRYDSRKEHLDLPAALARAGTAFSFLGRDGDELRRSVALAVRHGLDPEAAFAAATAVPAAQCGVAARKGTLNVGRDADFLVFDGDPIDLTARLTAVWIGGRRIEPATQNDADAR